MKYYSSFLFLFAVFIVVGAGCTSVINDKNPDTSVIEKNNNAFNFEEVSYDFAVIKQSGGNVTHDFAFTYVGENPITITGVPTSCACTSATVNKTKFNTGDRGVLTVRFNPNLHAEPDGKFFKTISLLTDPKIESSVEVKIWAEIDLDLGADKYELGQTDHEEEDEAEEEHALTAYQSITAEKFSDMLQEKDFTLIDVHIPEQEHIAGTDEFIPYTMIEGNNKLPQDKHAKIVLYCRSGGMSRAAAYALVEQGYDNVYDLSGGKNAYDAFVNQHK